MRDVSIDRLGAPVKMKTYVFAGLVYAWMIHRKPRAPGANTAAMWMVWLLLMVAVWPLGVLFHPWMPETELKHTKEDLPKYKGIHV